MAIMTFWEKLNKLMAEKNVTQRDLEKITGLSQPSISRWKSGTIPKADIALKIADYFGVSVHYLLPTKRPMIDWEKADTHIPSGQPEDIINIPFYADAKVSAGDGYENNDYQDTSTVPIFRRFIGQYNPKNVRMLEVTGDSMTGIHLFSGDLVFFVPVDNPADGLYVVGIEDKLFVKRIELDIMGNEIRIISENDRYPLKVLKGADMERLRIVGKVIGWITRHPY